jgi:hypothetical protein
MTLNEFKQKWFPFRLLLRIIILDGSETPRQKADTIRLLRIIMNDESTEKTYPEDVIDRFDGFCKKIMKRFTFKESLQKLISNDYYRTAFTFALGSDAKSRYEHIEIVIKAFSGKNDYDKFPCISRENLKNMTFSSTDEYDKFFKDLFNCYFDYGYLNNAIMIAEEFQNESLSEEELVVFYQTHYFQPKFGIARRRAGKLIYDKRAGRVIQSRLQQKMLCA